MNTAAAKQAIAKIGIHFTNCSFIVILSFPALRAYSLFLLLLVLFIGVKKAECNSHVQTQAHSQYPAMHGGRKYDSPIKKEKRRIVPAPDLLVPRRIRHAFFYIAKRSVSRQSQSVPLPARELI